MTQTDWGAEHLKTIGDAIRTLRGDHSAQWLSDQTEALGYKVSRSAISDIENQRRKYISTAELSVIAWVLAVPPARLMYPALPDGDVEIVPGVRTTAIQAMTWFSGETVFYPRRLFEGDPMAPVDDEWRANAARGVALSEGHKLVQLSRRRLEIRERIQSLSKLIARLKLQPPQDVQPFITETTNLQNELEYTERELRAFPGATIIEDPTNSDTE